MAGNVFDLKGMVSVDLSQVSQVPEEIKRILAGGNSTVNVGVNDAAAVEKTEVLAKEMKKLASTKVTPQVKVDTSEATRALNGLENKLKETEKQAKATKVQPQGIGQGSEIGSNLMMMQMIGGGALAGMGLGALTKEALSSATDEARMRAGVQRAFGAGGDSMLEYIDQLSQKSGYLVSDLMQATSVISDMGDAAGGIDPAQIEQLLTNIAGIARTSGLPQYREDILAVTEAIGRGMLGQARGLKLIGVNVSDAYMKTVAFGGSMKDTWDTMDMAARQTAYLNTILDQTASVSKAATDGTNRYAASTSKAKTAIHEAVESLGTYVIPVVTWIANTITSIPKPVLAGGAVVGGVAATAIGVGTMAYLGKGFLGGMGKMLGLGGKAAGEAAAGAALETSALAAGATLEASAMTAAATLEGGAVTAVATEEAGAIAEVATEEAGAATAAATLEAGAAVAAAELAGGGGAGGLVSKLGMALGANVTGLAAAAGTLLVAGEAIALGAVLLHIASGTKTANEQTAALAAKGVEQEQVLTAKKTGMGDMNDPEQRQYVRAYSRFIHGQQIEFNANGQRLGEAAQDWWHNPNYRYTRAPGQDWAPASSAQYSWQKVPEIQVTLNDQTSGGVQAHVTNPGSYAPVPH
jgi:hypothetical protein